MEYTKDIVLQVNYGQVGGEQKHTWRVFEKVSNAMSKHKVITTIVSITLMLAILDFMLVASFVDALSSI